MDLQEHANAQKWPRELPHQSAIQSALHKPYKRRRTAIVTALVASQDPEQKRWAERLAACCNTALLFHDPDTGQVRPWLPRCGSRLCPFCGQGRSARVADQLQAYIADMKAPRHITLTYRSRADHLGVQLNAMRAAFSKLRRHPEWRKRVVGGLYTIEVTRNNETGLWHPHLHVVVDGDYFPQKLLARLWAEVMDGGQHVWITKVDSSRNAAWELSKYVGKPPDAEGWPALAIQIFAKATRGTRMLQTFGNLHGKPTPEPEEKPAEQPNARVASLSSIVYLASTGVPVAMDLVALMWSRWPMFRGYLEKAAPAACHADHMLTSAGEAIPRPPPLPGGRPGPHTNRDSIAALDSALDRTLFYAWTLHEQGQVPIAFGDA